jgi:hypothetical protein
MRGDVFIDSETLLVINFVNFKIKSTQSFGGTHMNRVCICIFIRMNNHMCMSIYIYTVLKKDKSRAIFFRQGRDIINKYFAFHFVPAHPSGYTRLSQPCGSFTRRGSQAPVHAARHDPTNESRDQSKTQI